MKKSDALMPSCPDALMPIFFCLNFGKLSSFTLYNMYPSWALSSG